MLDFNDAKPQEPKLTMKVELSPLEAQQAFVDAMAAAGCQMKDSGQFVPSGKLERFELAEEKRGSGSGWYVYYGGEIAGAAFGSWRLDIKEKWCSLKLEKLTPQQRAEYDAKIERARKERLAVEEQNKAIARLRAQSIWENASPADPNHPYLQKKQIPAPGLKQTGDDRLLVPIMDMAGSIHSLQFISADGAKLYLKGGEKAGHFCGLVGEQDVIYIVEGYATGASVNLATNKLVYIAFDTSGLKPVARLVRANHSNSRIVIAADNDQFTDGNPGVTKAQEAATAIGAEVVVPRFSSMEGKPTDFNDLMVREGVDATKTQLTLDQVAVMRGVPLIADWGLDVYVGEPPEFEWVVDKLIPRGAATLLAAMGDTGKGYLALDLALKVSAGPDESKDFNAGVAIGWMGNPIPVCGSVVVFTAEDDKSEVHRRLNALDPDFVRRKRAGKKLHIIPLPNAGGPFSLIVDGPNGPQRSPEFHQIMDQLRRIPDLALVNFDPLASFVSADINADPAVGAKTTGALSSMATELNCAVLVAHHMGKTKSNNPIRNPEDARAMIRGSTAIVDGVRCALALWPITKKKAETVCKSLNTDLKPNKVYEAAIVKCNGPGDRNVKTMVRQENGLLVSREAELVNEGLGHEELLDLLQNDIREAALAGRPFSKQGGDTGTYERREELDRHVREFGRDKIREFVQTLLDKKRIVKCTYKSSVAKWLDVPGGPFAMGVGQIEPGMSRVSGK